MPNTNQHDILSRQAMMYLLTMGWFLAHTSLAMTPEHCMFPTFGVFSRQPAQ